MKVKNISVILLGLMIWAVSLSIASATTITVTYSGSADFGHGPVGYDQGTLNPNPGGFKPTWVYIGGDEFTTSSGAFNAWCVDIFHWMSGSTQTYTVGSSQDLITAFDSTKVADLLKLADEVYALVDTKEESAAFQEAVWAIMFGSKINGVYKLIGPTFKDFAVLDKSDPAANSLAQGWLDHLSTATDTGHYDLTYLYGNSNTQSVVVFTPVPEPSTLFLLGLGLAGLGMARRRLRKQ